LDDVKVIKVPKSPGIESQQILSEEKYLLKRYRDYFRGKFHKLYQKTSSLREEL
jgi:hypothetical protein